LPFFFLLVVAVVLITIFPQIVMWLPQYAFSG
jgi:TRAP-type C4-dicarboxylate transport system permease large subunit